MVSAYNIRLLAWLLSYAKSICTQYCRFENMGRFATLKKKSPKYEVQKVGYKKQGHLYSKRKEAALLFTPSVLSPKSDFDEKSFLLVRVAFVKK